MRDERDRRAARRRDNAIAAGAVVGGTGIAAGAGAAGIAAHRGAKAIQRIGDETARTGAAVRQSARRAGRAATAPARGASKLLSKIGRGMVKARRKIGLEQVVSEITEFRASELEPGTMRVNGTLVDVKRLGEIVADKPVVEMPWKKIKGMERTKGLSKERLRGVANHLEEPGIILGDGTLVDGRHRARMRKSYGLETGLYRRASKQDIKAAAVKPKEMSASVRATHFAAEKLRPGIYHGERPVKKLPILNHEYIAVVPRKADRLDPKLQKRLRKVGPNGELGLVYGAYNDKGMLRADIGRKSDVDAFRSGRSVVRVSGRKVDRAAERLGKYSQGFEPTKYPNPVANVIGRGKNSNSYARTALKNVGHRRASKKRNPGSNLYFSSNLSRPMKSQKIQRLARKLKRLNQFGYQSQPRDRKASYTGAVIGPVTGIKKTYRLNPSYSPDAVNKRDRQKLIPEDRAPFMIPETRRGVTKVARDVNRWGTRGANAVRDVGDVVKGKPRRKDAAGRPQKREWEKSYAKNAVRTGLIAGGIFLGGRQIRKNPKLRGATKKLVKRGSKAIDRGVNWAADQAFEELRPGMIEFKAGNSRSGLRATANYRMPEFAYGATPETVAAYLGPKQTSGNPQTRSALKRSGLLEKPRTTKGGVVALPKSAVRIHRGANSSDRIAGLLSEPSPAMVKSSGYPDAKSMNRALRRHEVTHSIQDAKRGYRGHRKIRELLRDEVGAYKSMDRGVKGGSKALRRVNKAGGVGLSTAAGTLSNPVLRKRAARYGAGGLALAAGALVASKIKRNRSKQLAALIEATELSIPVRDDRGRQVFRVEDVRGNSARIHSGDKPKRDRRGKRWHERLDNERKLWKGGVAAAALGGGAAVAYGPKAMKRAGDSKLVKAAKGSRAGKAVGRQVAARTSGRMLLAKNIAKHAASRLN